MYRAWCYSKNCVSKKRQAEGGSTAWKENFGRVCKYESGPHSKIIDCPDCGHALFWESVISQEPTKKRREYFDVDKTDGLSCVW